MTVRKFSLNSCNNKGFRTKFWSKLTCLVLLFLGTSVFAGELTLSPMFTDNMVLQRDIPAPVWGTADPGESITVTFAGQKKKTVADNNGNWRVTLDAMKASADPADFVVSARNSITLKNVLVGDVWICAGQSNMQMGINAVAGGKKAVAEADEPQIRLFRFSEMNADRMVKDFTDVSWKVCSPKTLSVGSWGGFSAAGYFFGKELHDKLKIPVGLIDISVGGSLAETWAPIEELRNEARLLHYVKVYDDYGQHPLYRPKDGVNKGEELGWQKELSDLSSWEKQTVPDGWFTNKEIYGAVWFRRTIEIPDALAGKDLVMNLGVIDDYDTTYFNGAKVGVTDDTTPGWWRVKRIYKIPGSLVKAGKNLIAVRIFNNNGGGGFYSKPEMMRLTGQGMDIPLAGEWLRKVEKTLYAFPRGIPWSAAIPGFFFEHCIAPMIPFAIRGAIWYQGESNIVRSYEYRILFPALIKGWRNAWGEGAFPFYFVQLPNINQPVEIPGESSWAALRESQALTLSVPNTGMAVTLDIGEAKDIHPKNKLDVGRRLALLALEKTYGKSVKSSGPQYSSHARENNRIRIYFRNTDGLTTRDSLDPSGFSICGPDKKFVWAKASIQGDSVVVSSPQVVNPIAVRYGWADNPLCNLTDATGLPAAPFRTDSFALPKEKATVNKSSK